MSAFHKINKYISILYRNNQAAMTRLLEPLGIGMGQYPYIIVVCEQPGLSQDDLTTSLLCNKSSVARAIAQLEQGGFLVRETDPADKRTYRLFPTDKGRHAYLRIHECLDLVNHDISAGLSSQERELAAHLLERMAANLFDGRQPGASAEKGAKPV